MAKPIMTRTSFLSMQVCVPKEFTDEQARDFAESKNPCGTEHGWQIREEGDPRLKGDPHRVQCREHPENVHIMLDA
jgi:hypothetical protein